MISNYLKIAWRHLNRHKGFSVINILGLATGMACFLLILQFVRFELSYESSYPNGDRVARITLKIFDGDKLTDEDCETYRPIGPMMTAEFPEVVNFTRVHNMDVQTIRYKDATFKESRVYMADSSCFAVFGHHFLRGNPKKALNAPFQAVLTEQTAQKYFGSTDIIGERLQLSGEAGEIGFEVVGVIENTPLNTHLKFDILLSYVTGFEFGWEKENWNSNNDYTYLLLDSPASFEKLEQSLITFNQNFRETRQTQEAFEAQLISDIHLHSHKPFEPETNGDADTVYMLGIIAIIIILLAWANYINLSTARAIERAREVGIRKVVGSNRNQLIWQFLLESVMVNLIAAVVALSLIQLSLPFFSAITGIPTSITLMSDPVFWLTFSLLFVANIVFSGFYPALVLSSFKAITVLKGRFSRSSQGRFLRNGLVILQFSASIILITGVFAVEQQLKYLKSKPLGMKLDQTLVVEAPAMDSLRAQYPAFKQALLQQSGIEGVAMASAVPGLPVHELSTTTGINLQGANEKRNFTFYITQYDPDVIPLLKMEMLAGDNFRPGEKVRERVIVNEASIRLWGIESVQEAIGRKLDFWGRAWTIVGVVKNFNQVSPKDPPLPMVILPTSYFSGYATIAMKSENIRALVAQVEERWNALFPGEPFSYFFLDDTYNRQYMNDDRFFKVFGLLTGLAIFIACLGLLGLASFLTLQRTKEIGIRKVLGATTRHIILLLSRDFTRLILIANVIAIPAAFFLINNWLENYAYRISVSWWLLLLPALAVFIIALIPVSTQTLKAAATDPVDTLRYE